MTRILTIMISGLVIFFVQAAHAETFPEIRVATAYVLTAETSNKISGTVSWITPTHTDETPITDYSVKFSMGRTLLSSIRCDVNVSNAQCSISGEIILQNSEENICSEKNQNSLNQLITVSVQAISRGGKFWWRWRRLFINL